MRNLINFLIRNISWFVFIALEIICFYFIFDTQAYQKSVFLNSSNKVSGTVYSFTGHISSYFGLKQENEELLEINAKLQDEVSLYRNFVNDLNAKSDSVDAISSELAQKFELQIARVINNSTSKSRNFITINKGSKDGVEVDMGVISHTGLVGIVRAVSTNNAVILPIINPESMLSAKIQRSNVSGTLKWTGGDPRFANIVDFPKSEDIQAGDTIVSSGFSEIFPEGIMIGTVEDYEDQFGGNFYQIKVRLFTNFNTLKNVIIMHNPARDEKVKLENELNKNVKS